MVQEIKMVYLLANKGDKNQMLYAFDPTLPMDQINYKLVRLTHVEYDNEGNILVNSKILSELESLNVPLFEKKSSAKLFVKGLSLVPSVKYIGIRFRLSHELNMIKLDGQSSWTQLNR